MTAIIDNAGEITRSPEDVFDYLSDIGNEVRWNSACESMERLTDGPVGVGTRYRAKWKQSPYVIAECTRYERPRVWAWQNGGLISVAMTITLEPTADGGTRMAVHGEWTPRGWFRLVFPIFVRVMRREEVRVFARAKRALEEGRDRMEASASPSVEVTLAQ